MSTELYLVYLTTVIVLLIAPGPMTLLTLSTSVRYGHRKALATVLGSNLAGLLLMILSATGIGALITSNAALYEVLRYAGAAYLLWLGFSAWRSRPSETLESSFTYRNSCSFSLFKQTLFVGLANPKGLIFFAALFPQFLDASKPMQPQLLVLCSTFTAVDFVILNLVAFGGCRLANRLCSTTAQRRFNRLCGLTFIGLGSVMVIA
ncbi:Threonine/homoserine/homoserine lactone efflux protein [Ferrimonas sediminum]|uniref:Threonine/homoserine/homoserine lactone efflux protein n=1 Tax=Ferrimonas sediminum TaxID=718193 RepID=A0A1G9AW01_9GAMM|nr:LysE family translocator [Ferrimonas sediminum]SDK31472.1 Threonine/homoserine/homoserine lactone efflux protein [Ferrimonas sediminum]